MNKVFRLRPSNDKTIEEIKEGYIWLSRPIGFNDVNDSNILSFVKLNESINDAFIRVFRDIPRMANDASKNGICCFTKILPKLKFWKKFPSGKEGIFIGYNRDLIEKHFLRVYGIGDCFKKVEYLTEPLILETSSGYDVLWEKEENGSTFKSIKDFERDSKQMDLLFLKMFTRINFKYKYQDELRIILGGRNVLNMDEGLKGYKIGIPKESIVKIYIQPSTPSRFLEKMKSVLTEEIPMEIIEN